MEWKGIIVVGNMLVDYVYQIGQWLECGWLVEIVYSECVIGGVLLNVLLILVKMYVGLLLQVVGLIGEDNDGDYIIVMFDQYYINCQFVQCISFVFILMIQVMIDVEGQCIFFYFFGVNCLFDFLVFELLDVLLKIFYFGYLLLFESFDCFDEVYGICSV